MLRCGYLEARAQLLPAGQSPGGGMPLLPRGGPHASLLHPVAPRCMLSTLRCGCGGISESLLRNLVRTEAERASHHATRQYADTEHGRSRSDVLLRLRYLLVDTHPHAGPWRVRCGGVARPPTRPRARSSLSIPPPRAPPVRSSCGARGGILSALRSPHILPCLGFRANAGADCQLFLEFVPGSGNVRLGMKKKLDPRKEGAFGWG
ncbi:NPKL2 [Panicum miliaceum]|uniref:NPKL2 n=1 Tax=Panicum miliaceum TaxID=4540 RepID=A0A3L6RRE3_PANMI|nr:NPKL2 [Panicum miliaceum]